MHEQTLKSDTPFWRFSLAVYQAPGVADECLALQRAFDIDVNVLLFCVWAAAAHRARLDEQEIEEIAAAVRPWQETVVRPLRLVRQDLKTMPQIIHPEVQALRSQVAAVELQAEQVEQALVFAGSVKVWTRDDQAAVVEIVRANVATFMQSQAKGGAATFSTGCLVRAAVAVADQFE